VVLGDRLGLYRSLVDGGPQTPSQLAARSGCHPRLVEEWMHAQVTSDYIGHDEATGTYFLEPEQAACLVDEDSPAFLMPYVSIASVLHRDEERVADAFRCRSVLAWSDHHRDLYAAFARSAPADYAPLVPEWIPALDGIEDRLRTGARVVDVGCGEGTPTLMLATAFPDSTFAGFDTHAEAIVRARRAAADAGLSDRVTFEVGRADEVPGDGYDLVCTFDALHDMGDPVGVARHLRSVLAPDGVWMIVDRNAADTLEGNRGPVGRFSYAASSFLCVPNAVGQGCDSTPALGAQAGEARLRQVAIDAGFARVRRAAETSFNLVLEVRR
jgi:2-polyprenyl-3-methyl-5-hydroxy-6-metoxy-1,4-benzoquinol methylase